MYIPGVESYEAEGVRADGSSRDHRGIRALDWTMEEGGEVLAEGEP